MPLAYQNTLALLFSFVVHICIAAVLAHLEYSAGKETSSLLITLSPAQTLSPSTRDTAAFNPIGTATPQPPKPESAPEIHTEMSTRSMDSKTKEPTIPADEMFPATKRRSSSGTTARESANSPTHIPDLATLFGTHGKDGSVKEARQGSADKTQPASGHPSLLSPFQPYLLNHISQKKYHDKQYSFSALKQEKLVMLEITLHPNGTLINTRIARSSGDDALDQAATRATIAASPFKPPPTVDRRFDYTYVVSIQYLPE